MPLHETLDPVKVTLIVEVDGHRLTFSQTGKAAGARYHGTVPKHGYTLANALENDIRDTVTHLMAVVSARLYTTLQRLYPIHTDNREDPK